MNNYKLIDELLKNGLSPNEILKKVDTYGSAISRRAKKLGLRFKCGRKEIPICIGDVTELISDHGPRGAARELNCSYSKLYHFRKLNGLKIFQRGGHKDERKRKIVKEMKLNGMTYGQIAEQVGTSRQAVQQLLKIPKNMLSEKCDKCGSGGLLHGHHTDYSTNSFQTLCVSCHAIIHNNVRDFTTIS